MTHSKAHDFTAKDILQSMAARNVILPEKNHSWDKMLVFPKQGESLFSWLMRQAWKFGMTPRKLIQSEKEYWMQKENISLSFPNKGLWAVTLDVLPVSTDWDKVLGQRGLNISVRELQLNISKWFDLMNEPEVTEHKLKNYYHYNLRYCPACWKDKNTRYLRVLWRLPFVIVCPEHGVELIEYCSSCDKLLFGDKKYHQASSVILENAWDDFLIKCRHCNHPLTDEVMKENPEMSRLQNKVLNILLSDFYWTTQGRYIVFWHTYQTIIEKRKIDCAEARLKVMETLLEKPPLISYPNYYPQDLLIEIERRFQVASLYLSGTPAKDLAKKFKLTEFSIRIFAKDLINEKPIEEILKRQFGYTGKLGFELAQAELRAFKSKCGRLPKSSEMMGIRSAITDQEWVSFGIKTWNSLLMRIFGEINTDWGIYVGEKGLERVMTELRIFKSKHNRLPITTDEKIGGIVSAVNEKEWASFGIEKWNDLLMKTFGNTNIKMGVYKGEIGLKRTIMELQAFKTKYNRLPKISDKGMGGIYGAIKRGEWVSFKISSWNDLLRRACGEINTERKIYTGEAGLKRAMEELQAFKAKHGKLPRNKDKEMCGIVAAIRHRSWASIGVMSWNDLLWRAFGSVNKK